MLRMGNTPENAKIPADILFDEAFIRDWPQVRAVIAPTWEKVLGFPLPPITLEIQRWNASAMIDPNPIVVVVAQPEKLFARIQYAEEEILSVYDLIFHEAIHLWAHIYGINFPAIVHGLSREEMLKEYDRVNALGDHQDDMIAILEFFHLDSWEAAQRVGQTAYALDESATQAMAMLLTQQFYKDQELDPAFILNTQFDLLFTCDDPTRYPLLIAALMKHEFDIEQTARYFFFGQPEMILTDLSEHLNEIKSLRGIKATIRRVRHHLHEQGINFDTGAGTYVSAETVDPVKQLIRTIPELPHLRPLANQLSPFLEGELIRAYVHRDVNAFIREATNTADIGTIAGFTVHAISRSYNKLLENLEESRNPMWPTEVHFCSDLYTWVLAHDPSIRFKVEHVVKQLKDSLG